MPMHTLFAAMHKKVLTIAATQHIISLIAAPQYFTEIYF